MRTIDAITTNALGIPSYGVAVRVSVMNSGGAFVDLSTFAGQDMQVSATWQSQLDSATDTATITLFRNENATGLSLSPMMTGSAINRGYNPANAYAPLLAPFRQMKIEVSIHPYGGALDWNLVFQGRIDSVDFGAGNHITVECSDLSGPLRDAVIEQEKIYGYGDATHLNGMRPWYPNTAYALNDYVLPQPVETGYYYKCTTAGTTGFTPPAVWTTTVGATTTDNTAVFQCVAVTNGFPGPSTGQPMEAVLQAMLNDLNLATPVTLWVPASPGAQVTRWTQSRGMALDEMRKIPQQIGWDLRYLWNSGAGAFQLALYQPQRTKTVADYTFSAYNILAVSMAKQDLANVRNVVRIDFYDTTNFDPAGKPTLGNVTVTDAGSVTTFGRRYMEIDENNTTHINTPAAATVMANAALNDLSAPLLEQTVKVRLFPFTQLGDLYTFSADGIHYDTDQSLAVISVTHTIAANSANTEFGVRGKPAGAYLNWIAQSKARPTPYSQIKQGLDSANGPTFAFNVAAIPTGGRFTATVSNYTGGLVLDGFEIHVSTTNGFTPSTSTLYARGKALSTDLTGLTTGTTYYVRAIPYGLKTGGQYEVRGAPSQQVSFVAGGVTSAMISGTFPKSAIASAGTWATTDIPNLDTSKITTGNLALARLDTNVASKLYVQSRGMNLCTNGFGQFGDKTNFSTFDAFDATRTPGGGGGSFRGIWPTLNAGSDEAIPVDPKRAYELRAFVIAAPFYAGAQFYTGVNTKDLDGNWITNKNWRENGGYHNTRTTLAAPLSVGNTTITVATTAINNWYTGAVGDTWARTIAIGFGSYKNGAGFAYPDYTQWTQTNAYSNTGINTTTKVITLNAAWTLANPAVGSGGTWPIGTAIANCPDSDFTNVYIDNAANLTASWAQCGGTFGGPIGGGMGQQDWPNDGTNICGGALAYIVPMLLPNRGSVQAAGGAGGDAATNFANIWFGEIIDSNQIAKLQIVDAHVASGAAIAKSKVATSGTWATADIPNLDTSKITTGTFGSAFLAAGAVTTAKLAAGAIDPTVALLPNSITGSLLVNNTLNSTQIANFGVAVRSIDSTTWPVAWMPVNAAFGSLNSSTGPDHWTTGGSGWNVNVTSDTDVQMGNRNIKFAGTNSDPITCDFIPINAQMSLTVAVRQKVDVSQTLTLTVTYYDGTSTLLAGTQTLTMTTGTAAWLTYTSAALTIPATACNLKLAISKTTTTSYTARVGWVHIIGY